MAEELSSDSTRAAIPMRLSSRDGHRVEAFWSAAKRIDLALWAILALFLAITAPRLGTVPIWDSRVYYDLCLVPALRGSFNPLDFNCFGHPSMLYMLPFAVGQLLVPGSAVLLNAWNLALGCLGVAAFWMIAGVLLPRPESRLERILATAIFAVWPGSVANCLNMSPDYGVFIFFLLFLAFLLQKRPGLAAVSSIFLVFSKETGLLLYGLILVLFPLVFVPRADLRRTPSIPKVRNLLFLFAPAILFIAVAGLTLTRRHPVVWRDSPSLPSILKRFVVFNPAEIFVGPYGPAVWILNFSWILNACLLAALVTLALRPRSRVRVTSGPFARRPLLFLLLVFGFATYALTRYQTYVNVRYLLPIAPLQILLFVVALWILFPPPPARYALLGAAFLLLFASDFRTIDPVSRRLWGTFPFGRHELLKLTSWNNECCGFSRDQLVYNLEYLKFHEIQNDIFRDLRPRIETTLLADPKADFFLAGAVTPDGQRTLRIPGTIPAHYLAVGDLARRRSLPETVYFFAFPNFDNRAEFQRLRRDYEVASVKSYERAGYAIPVYTMRQKGPRAARIVSSGPIGR